MYKKSPTVDSDDDLIDQMEHDGVIIRSKFIKRYKQKYRRQLESTGDVLSDAIKILKDINKDIEKIPIKKDITRRIHEIKKDVVMNIIEKSIDKHTDTSLGGEERNPPPEYKYYPDQQINEEASDGEFNETIYNKREFNKTQYTEGLSNTSAGFTLSNSQTFVRNYISEYTPYNGVLIWHEVGVGKTCSGISIAENFKKKMYLDGKKTLILTPSETLQQNWRDEIFNIEKELKRIDTGGPNVQCTGETYYKEAYNLNKDNIDKVKIKIKKDINLYYEFYGYGKLARSIQSELKHYRVGKKSIQKTKIEYIKKRFSNRVIIMDEVHVIRESGSNKDKKSLPYIEMIAKYAENTKFILLTATPMYNVSKEIILLLNLLLWNDKRSPIEEDEYFKKNGLEMKSEAGVVNKFLKYTKGYISYVRGENPITFPIKISPTSDETYTPIHVDGVSENEQLKDGNIVLYKNELSDWQKHHLAKYDSDGGSDESMLLSANAFSIKPSQAANIIFPIETVIESGELEGEFEGEIADNGINQCFEIKDGVYYYEDHLKSAKVPFLHRDNLSKYSMKFSNILKSITECEGIAFVFSQFLAAGNLSLALVLEENGFTKYDGNDVTKNLLESDSSRDMFCAKHNKYYSELDSIQRQNFIQAKYILLDGSVTKTKLNNLVKECRGEGDHSNVSGEHIKIVLGTRVVEQGVSFLNIRQVHIVDPWHHLNQMKQATGRAIRSFSHHKLPENKRNVTIYLHSAYISDLVESSDERIYRKAFIKKKNMISVELLLKKNAIDCELNRNNNIRSSLLHEGVKNTLIDSKGDTRTENKYDTDYSEQCHFVKCDYKCDGIGAPDKHTTDISTLNSYFSSDDIGKIKARINEMYKTYYSYDFEGIKRELHDIPNEDIYSALTQIINDKESLYDGYNRRGHIIERTSPGDGMRGVHYTFQPVVFENNTPLLYRYIPNFKKHKSVSIDFEFPREVRENLKIRLPKSKSGYVSHEQMLEKLVKMKLKTDIHVIETYPGLVYGEGSGKRDSLVKEHDSSDPGDRDTIVIPGLDDFKKHLFYSVYEDGDDFTQTERMHILKQILEKQIKFVELTDIEELIYDYYNNPNRVNYILCDNHFTEKNPDIQAIGPIEGFRFITNKGKFVFKKNEEGIMVQIDRGYEWANFSPNKKIFERSAEQYGFIEKKTKRDKSSSNEFVIINNANKEAEHKTLSKQHNKKYDITGAVCGQARGAKDKSQLRALMQSFIGKKNYGDEKEHESKAKKCLPHKNFNDGGGDGSKRTMCQELELILRYMDNVQPTTGYRYFYTFEERMLELELINKQKS